LVRSAIMVLIALAVARPFFESGGLAGAISQGRFTHVLMVDDSLSMQHVGSDGHSAFDRAMAAARSLLDGFGTSDAVALVTAGAPARAIIARPAYDLELARRALESLQVSDGGTDAVGALAKVKAALAEADTPPGTRQVYLITDAARGSWSPQERGAADAAGAELNATPARASAGAGIEPTRTTGESAGRVDRLLREIAEQAKVTVVDVGAKERGNLAVSAVRCVDRLVAPQQATQIEAVVSNYDAVTRRNVAVTALVDGRVHSTQRISTIEPGARGELSRRGRRVGGR
jgi:hypothetical protein